MSKPILIIETPNGCLDEATRHEMREQLRDYITDYYCIIIDGTGPEFKYFVSPKEALSKKELAHLKTLPNK